MKRKKKKINGQLHRGYEEQNTFAQVNQFQQDTPQENNKEYTVVDIEDLMPLTKSQALTDINDPQSIFFSTVSQRPDGYPLAKKSAQVSGEDPERNQTDDKQTFSRLKPN